MNSLKKLRNSTYQLLENEKNISFASKVTNFFLIVLIITNVFAVIIASEGDILASYESQFYWFEVISLAIFSIEYLLRFWSCVESSKYSKDHPTKARIKYFFSAMAIIDLMAILPFIIALFLTVDLRVLRLFRVLRLLKLTHHFKGFNIFVTVILKEMKSITAAIMMMLFLVTIAASLMHTIEGASQPEAFGSITKSFWWAVVTMTTVGYGDVVPVTSTGKIIAVFIMLIGVGLVALPAGMLAARFGEELRERKRDLNVHIREALVDGHITPIEYKSLVKLADDLELQPEDLKRSINLLKHGHQSFQCPHCGKSSKLG